jgi:hypothetical protein
MKIKRKFCLVNWLMMLLFQLEALSDDDNVIAGGEGEPSNVDKIVEGQTHAGSPRDDAEADVDAEELRCEGVEFIDLGHVFVQTFFSPSEASHISWRGTSFSVNILHDISIYFISLVYLYYLIFVRRLKHNSAWLGKSFLPTQRHSLLSRQL